MSEKRTISIEVDGQQLTAEPGQMLIEVTDAAGITVPRFCYHKKLSIAANCRMCLVEVQNAPKPLPACATPVMDGMKAFTRSPLAREAQKGTMEFLLINHPLDCPICDQGGECELQDVAMGYGSEVTRFNEGKRVVKSQNIGSLIATDMTRCIHCTRCVRFGDEIAGVRELGAIGRGEHMQIGVYVGKTVASELSGNVIDLCPVGALTSKPSRYTARAWELVQREGVAGHDGVGSTVYFHVRRNQVMRVVPRENEATNETWISDRDRFSYQGLYAKDRLEKPMVRVDGKLQEASWHDALMAAVGILKKSSASLGTLISPSATLEEMYLAQKLSRGLGSNNIDHRLRQLDFRNPASDPSLPWLGQRMESMAQNQATLLVGSWLRKDQPMLNHWLRKSVLQDGVVMAINPLHFDFNYELGDSIYCQPSAMVQQLAGVARALGADTAGIKVDAGEQHRKIAEQLKAAAQGSILLGSMAQMHPDFTLLRTLAANIAAAAGINMGFVSEGANSTGAWIAAAVPHRGLAAQAVSEPGLDTAKMIQADLDAYLLVNVEPEFDVGNPVAIYTVHGNSQVVAITAHLSPDLEKHGDVLLPAGIFAETSGSLVNIQGDIQSFTGAVSPVGEARPGWKILRVLGNLADLDGFDFDDTEQVRAEILAAAEPKLDNSMPGAENSVASLLPVEGLERISGVPIYSVDGLTRRSSALQHTPDSWKYGIRINGTTAAHLGLAEGDSAVLKQDDKSVTLPVALDDRLLDSCVWMPLAVPGSELLGVGFGPVSLEKA
jgi:NADH-quinone oxidoreductase subunit G